MSEPASTIDAGRTRGSKSPEQEYLPQAVEPKERVFTDQEREELTHFVVYGQPNSEPPSRRTLAPDWDTEDFVTPITSPWDITLTKEKVERLRLGFNPAQMEDKWFVFADGDEGKDAKEEGMRVHFFRSWTGNKIFEVVVELDEAKEGEDGKGGQRGGKIKELIWESSQEVVGNEGEEGAKEMAIEVCRWVLDVELRSKAQIEEQERRDEEEWQRRRIEE